MVYLGIGMSPVQKLVYTPVDATVTAIRNYQVPSAPAVAGSDSLVFGLRLR